jgi:hypothetical protein
MHATVHMMVIKSSTTELFSEVFLTDSEPRHPSQKDCGLHDGGTVSCRDIEGSLRDHYVETGPGVRLPTRLHRVLNVKMHEINPHFLCMPSRRVA